MRVRIAVADQSEARFYDAETPSGPLHPVGRILDPKAHLHNQDFVSDRPGRVFDHASPPHGRRGAVARHGTGGERTPRKQEALSFARTIAEKLDSARREGQFDRVVLIASPTLLGMLREVFPAALRAMITAEVHKNLLQHPDTVILEHVPTEAFRHDLSGAAD